MSKSSFQTPILFLIFNRKDTALKVIDVLRTIKPAFLFIAADGPREHKTGEKERCLMTREAVLKAIDWNCEVKTLMREKNLGCGLAVSGAIDWFFENVEEGIILEDDVLPSIDFFRYADELLSRYRNDVRVMSIAAPNLMENQTIGDKSYFFSEYVGIWGWATWKRAWNGYDYNLRSWSKMASKSNLKNRFSAGQFRFFYHVFASVKKINTWDYQWWCHHLLRGGLSITPAVNLSINIGFTNDATHTLDAPEEIKHAQIGDLSFPLKHPEYVRASHEYDLQLARKYYWRENFLKVFFQRVTRKIKKYV